MFTTYAELRRLRKRVVALEAQIEQERARHLQREDALVNVALTSHGHRGISEPSVEKPKVERVIEPQALSAEDEATFSYYKQCARDAGLSEDEAERWFAAYLNGEEPVMQMEN
jgi:hypothetical protein